MGIKEFWRKKAEGLKDNPKFFHGKTFINPLPNTKDSTKAEKIHFNVNRSAIKNQKQVSKVLVEYFATFNNEQNWRYGDAAECKAMEDFKDLPCVQEIQQETDINAKQTMSVNPAMEGKVPAVLESLNIRKATGSDAYSTYSFKKLELRSCPNH